MTLEVDSHQPYIISYLYPIHIKLHTYIFRNKSPKQFLDPLTKCAWRSKYKTLAMHARAPLTLLITKPSAA